ncbi:PHD and RING finger domain-containing protein 1-like isoform X2 [Macrosteles quadrilineatus]|uniref:PHD and RING finger domain-containing protein 1-like isoform X2 n=1 Tax=Macrosteles quadrilineatus TaxID=74068 RepID=UPI0023E0FB38|nr:PHD and RING finger domain-containing protein 1-like isoform X2 [Macrosteles quadrilineatus]
MSDDSDNTNNTEKRCKRPLKAASSSDSSDSSSPLAVTKRSRKQLAIESESEASPLKGSDNSSPLAPRLNRRRRVPVVASDDDSSSSEDEEIIAIRPAIRRGILPILSDYESGTSNAGDDAGSESDGNMSNGESKTHGPSFKNKMEATGSGSSSDSDGQSERCPICLIKFVSQEVGTPETCDHFFCAPCIEEWSKNVNTCPVDRQPYRLILVREHLDGKVIRQVSVGERTSNLGLQEPAEEDSTVCEVCYMADREETLLLCDGCDNGYHMECLYPPLEYVPIEEWYCPECAPQYRRGRSEGGSRRHQRDEPGPEQEEEDGDDDLVPLSHFRLIPRTRQSERVRRNVRRNNQQVDAPAPTTSSGVESGGRIRARATTRPRRRTNTQTRRTGVRIKRIVTDDGVIEVILKCKKKGKKRRGRKKRSKKTVLSLKTAKGRLAARLGMCKPKITKQTIPETVNKQEISSTPINYQRYQAGIPTLDLFGRRDQLDYFSVSEGEDDIGSMEGGVGVLSRTRVARPIDRLLHRKKAASILTSKSPKKSVKIDSLSSPAGPSLLDSILDSQALWHSKQTEIKSNSDGTLKVVPKGGALKEENKVDVKKATAPVKESPMFPTRTNSGSFMPENSSRGGGQSGNQGHSERSEDSSYQSSAPASAGYSRSEGPTGGGSSSLRGAPPIRFRMNIPPRRPNIHSYPSENIPPPPPLRLRSPMNEVSFPTNNSPEASPEREEEDVDIYSDIEQESNTEERTFGILEPPPEPPFLMTMEPPPEPPAMLMNLNDDGSDDEPSGLVIDDPPPGDVYDPCAVNSDESSNEGAPLAKPPDIPSSLRNPELVANYSSDSCPTQGSASYNPELPTYSSTPIIGPLPRPASHNSTDAEDDDECPNFSLYSATSMKLAHRGIDLDIPIPPPIEKGNTQEDSMDIPLPDDSLPVQSDKENCESIPTSPNKGGNVVKKTSPSPDRKSIDESPRQEETRDSDQGSERGDDNKRTKRHTGEMSADEDDEGEEEEEDDGRDVPMGDSIQKDKENRDEDDDKSDCESVHESNGKIIRTKSVKNKDAEAGEDECSTQGDILDLAIESEANLENNLPHDDSEEHNEITLVKSPVRLEENDDKIIDGGDKSDGLVDITDEEMSVYDGQDNIELEKINEEIRESIQNEKKLAKSLDSDDENSLVGGATSAVSAASFNDSDNIQTSTLPGLEGLETETISESEDVNFDELPLENEQHEEIANEDELNSFRKKKRRKSRKISQNEEISNKGSNEPLEFEEGEIIEDKPKKEKKSKPKPEVEIEVDENVELKKPKQPVVEKDKDSFDKKSKKKKDKNSSNKEKTDKKDKEPKEKTLKPGEPDENISWKKLSKSTKERNYRDGKEKDDKEREKDKDRDREKKEESSKKKSREKRKELERYDVRRLISEKPKQPKKDEFGRDISPSSSSLSPYRPPRYRSPLRTRNRSRTRSKSWRSRSRSRGRRRRSRSRGRVRSRDRSKRSRSRERSRKRSRSKNRVSSHSRDRRRSLDNKTDRVRTAHRSVSRGRRKTRSRSHHSHHSKKQRSYSKSWSPSWSRSSMSKSRSPRRRRRSKSISRSRSRSWSRERVPSLRGVRTKDPPKNLTVIVPNKEALKKKEKKKTSKKKDDRRKKKRGQSPAPSKEVFTSGDNILVSVNFKNANKNPEIIPATTPLLRESSKRKRDDLNDSSAKKKKSNSSSKKTPGKKSNRLAKINEAAKNAKPVAIIDLDVSPFRAQTPSPKEVIVLSDSGDEGSKQHHSEMQDEINRLGHSGMNQSMHSLSSDHGQKNAASQPESPVSSFMHNSSGPKTPPEPHIKFSISTKQSQIRILNNPLMETEEEMHEDNAENEMNEIMHKGPNTPPEPPPEMTTPASPPTTPYDPFDPTKSRSPSPQPRSDTGLQMNTAREDKLENVQSTDDDHPSLNEPRTSTPPNETEETKKTPEPPKVHSTPKHEMNTEQSPKVSPPVSSTDSKLPEDSLMQPIKKLLADANKLNVTVHKSPEKLITVVISQQTKNQNQTPKQPVLPLKAITPNKQSTPKSNSKHQLFTNVVKQVPILGTLLPGPPAPGLNNSRMSNRSQQNGDTFEDMDIDPSSPYSPGSSEGDDLFEPPVISPPRSSSKPMTNKSKPTPGNKFDSLFGSSPAKNRHLRYAPKPAKKSSKSKLKGSKKEEVKVKLDEDQLKILDDLPSSAVEMQVKDKFLKKLNRQERVVEEVKLVLKPHYAKKHVNKEEYKEILRRSVPKICHNKSGEINPIKIQHLVEAYVKKFRYAKKKASGTIQPPAAQNKPKPQKTLWS